MQTITLRGYFDGKHIRLDEPFELKPDTKLIITVLPEGGASEEYDAWMRFSSKRLEKAFGGNEPEYAMNLVKEPNPDYDAGRRPHSRDT